MLSASKGLQFEEPLLFELGTPADSNHGVDIPPPPAHTPRLGGLARRTPPALPNVSEPEVVRHFTRLSQKNYAIDSGFYPLGSCTMKHNPRLNEALARLPGFAAAHPYQPESTLEGAKTVMKELGHWLCTLTGMAAASLSPAAGAHGEFCGMMTIRAALTAKGRTAKTVLVPESAHGTNPATAAACGFLVRNIKAEADGRVSAAMVHEHIKACGDDVAAIMLTNPNTCGLFEREIIDIAAAVHEAGGYFYCDGANFNAIVGRVRPADLGVDAMHINLHKTFSTPHGGGGPGSGPVVFSAALAPYAPAPIVLEEQNDFQLLLAAEAPHRCGILKAYLGQFGTFVRALAYMMSMGSDGLAQASGDAVLNANYLAAQLRDVLSLSFEPPVMHEALFDDRFLKDTGITTLDIAKALIDEGFHPMTMYFPLVVPGALLMEPTETESKETLDLFIAAMHRLVARAKAGDIESFKAAPRHAPRRRLDETKAARTPVLRWHKNVPYSALRN
jgi:glycine dehydrogenase subunit 2